MELNRLWCSVYSSVCLALSSCFLLYILLLPLLLTIILVFTLPPASVLTLALPLPTSVFCHLFHALVPHGWLSETSQQYKFSTSALLGALVLLVASDVRLFVCLSPPS